MVLQKIFLTKLKIYYLPVRYLISWDYAFFSPQNKENIFCKRCTFFERKYDYFSFIIIFSHEKYFFFPFCPIEKIGGWLTWLFFLFHSHYLTFVLKKNITLILKDYNIKKNHNQQIHCMFTIVFLQFTVSYGRKLH